MNKARAAALGSIVAAAVIAPVAFGGHHQAPAQQTTYTVCVQANDPRADASTCETVNFQVFNALQAQGVNDGSGTLYLPASVARCKAWTVDAHGVRHSADGEYITIAPNGPVCIASR